MKKILMIMAVAAASLAGWLALSSSQAPEVAPETQQALFEQAVELIKRYETLHQPRHWPLVGYGHMVMRGERYSRKRTMAEADAEALLRKDLLKNCAVFRDYGADSLLLAVLAYNIGPGNVKRSSVARKLAEGDRDIAAAYLAHCRYRGRRHAGLAKRRAEELELLFITDSLLLRHTPAAPPEMAVTDTVAVAADNNMDNNPSKPLGNE